SATPTLLEVLSANALRPRYTEQLSVFSYQLIRYAHATPNSFQYSVLSFQPFA
ncbi:MAG: hypothetical protein F6J98_34540, partial [Moorea sp. SIO4G2]|nr:hypothetical protein [Moorena sp. SIO4G2]